MIYNSHNIRIVSHQPFCRTRQGAVLVNDHDIANHTLVFERMESRVKIAQTDQGRSCRPGSTICGCCWRPTAPVLSQKITVPERAIGVFTLAVLCISGACHRWQRRADIWTGAGTPMPPHSRQAPLAALALFLGLTFVFLLFFCHCCAARPHGAAANAAQYILRRSAAGLLRLWSSRWRASTWRSPVWSSCRRTGIICWCAII